MQQRTPKLFTIKKDGPESIYTKKVVTPIYEPTNKKPRLFALLDTTKYESLLADIEKSKLDEKEKQFLRTTATRQIVFNYKLIADYYAHSDKEMQELMEKLALVIVDYDKAIEYGYVKLQRSLEDEFMEQTGINIHENE